MQYEGVVGTVHTDNFEGEIRYYSKLTYMGIDYILDHVFKTEEAALEFSSVMETHFNNKTELMIEDFGYQQE